ncbi:hypothetical protein AAY473_016290 [Plecturocebus cupreus]
MPLNDRLSRLEGTLQWADTGFCHVDQAGLEFLIPSDRPTSAFESAGIIGVSHRTHQCGEFFGGSLMPVKRAKCTSISSGGSLSRFQPERSQRRKTEDGPKRTRPHTVWEELPCKLHVSPTEIKTSLANMVKLCLYQNTKTSQAWWQVPVVPATQEAEAGESLEPRRQRLQ